MEKAYRKVDKSVNKREGGEEEANKGKEDGGRGAKA